MSLILAYHNPDFGVVCTDGRVSQRQPDGSHTAVPDEVGIKFAVLRHNLILAGSSSWCGALDLWISGRMREIVEAYPTMSFAEIASALPVVVASARRLFPIPPGTVINLILMGYDPTKERVRNISFAFTDGACEQCERNSGAVASGFVEPEEEIGRKILDGMGEERTIEAARASMGALAQKIAESRPNVIGAPYFFHVVSPDEAPRHHLNKHQDNIPDGPTYSRTLGTRVNAGRPTIDFSEAIHNNQNLDHMPDGSGRFSVINGAGLKAVSSVDGSNKALIDFASGHTNQNLDHMPNGTRAAWDSTTQKGSAVDALGNVLLKNLSGPTPTTVAPSTSSTSYSVIPEMTTTITTKGNKVLIIFSGSFASSTSLSVGWQLAFFRDGVQISNNFIWGTVDTIEHVIALSFLDSPSAASHTYDVRWVSNSGSTLTNFGLDRSFQLVELG